MKKTISTILVCVLLIGSIFSLSSCEVAGFVFGTYSRTYDALVVEETVTYKFGLGKVEVITTTEGQISGNTETTTKEYKYKVTENEKGEKVIIFTVENDNDAKPIELSFNSGSDDGGAYIEIGGIRYYAVK